MRNGPPSLNTPLPDSEDAVRHSKAALSVDAAFAAEGLGNPPAGLAAIVSDYVNRSTRDIPASKLAGMAPGSGNLGTAAAAGVNIALGSLTPDQRTVMRAGGNPLNPADMASIGAKLGLAAYSLQAKGSALSSSSGNNFAELRAKSGATGDASTASGSGYSWLSPANQNIAGFSKAQVASAANFLKGAGLNRDEVNEDTKHMVHLSKHRKDIGDFIKRKKDIEGRRARGEDTTEDEAKLEQDKKGTRERMTPNEREHFDRFKAIQNSNRRAVSELGIDAARDLDANVPKTSSEEKPQKKRLADHDQHQTAQDKTKSHVKAVTEADDVFGAAPASSPVKKAEAETTPQSKPDEPKRPVQQASNKKARAPTLSA